MPAPAPFPLIRFAAVASTNVVALDLARQGGETGTVVLARQQEQGRGRGKKTFASPPGGLYMSVILRPGLPNDKLPLITLAAGVACARAIEGLSGQVIALKWPNDLYLHGRKLGGILAETGAYSVAIDAIPFVVLGIGINVNTCSASLPQELRTIVTSLYDVSAEQYDIDALVAAIHLHLEELVPQLKTDVPQVLRDWQARDYLRDREIFWQDTPGTTLQGRGAGIRADGCYQLRTQDGTQHAILAGEVSLGPPAEQR